MSIANGPSIVCVCCRKPINSIASPLCDECSGAVMEFVRSGEPYQPAVASKAPATRSTPFVRR
jgi:hypothetical protein